MEKPQRKFFYYLTVFMTNYYILLITLVYLRSVPNMPWFYC